MLELSVAFNPLFSGLYEPCEQMFVYFLPFLLWLIQTLISDLFSNKFNVLRPISLCNIEKTIVDDSTNCEWSSLHEWWDFAVNGSWFALNACSSVEPFKLINARCAPIQASCFWRIALCALTRANEIVTPPISALDRNPASVHVQLLLRLSTTSLPLLLRQQFSCSILNTLLIQCIAKPSLRAFHLLWSAFDRSTALWPHES